MQVGWFVPRRRVLQGRAVWCRIKNDPASVEPMRPVLLFVLCGDTLLVEASCPTERTLARVHCRGIRLLLSLRGSPSPWTGFSVPHTHCVDPTQLRPGTPGTRDLRPLVTADRRRESLPDQRWEGRIGAPGSRRGVAWTSGRTWDPTVYVLRSLGGRSTHAPSRVRRVESTGPNRENRGPFSNEGGSRGR